jgi:cephalosporin hydroxylase
MPEAASAPTSRSLGGRVARLLPAMRRHLDADRVRAQEHRATVAALAAATREREALAAALAARDAGSGSALPVGGYVVHREQPALTEHERAVVDRFHDLYYSRWRAGADTINVAWFGWRLLKCPLDLWVYQELIVRLRPAVIVETGTFMGGSALFLASLLDLLGEGEVVTVDVEAQPGRPVHPRLRYITGSSVAPSTVAELRAVVAGRSCLVLLDSDHHRDHVLAELRTLVELVPVGGYIVVEDSNINGHPTYPSFGPGPMEAIEAFLAEDRRFESDPAMERFLMTLNPRGFLRRIA